MNPALSVRKLSVSLPATSSDVRVVDRVSLDLDAGEMIGLAGESGCGKTMLAMAIMDLLGGTGARVEAKSLSLGAHVADLSSGSSLARHRGRDIAMVFQEPSTALDPVLTIGWQLSAVLMRRHDLNRSSAREKSLNALTDIGFSNVDDVYRAYPHQLSGGMRQLAMIAMAVAVRPRVLIADEPTTALDVTTQRQAMSHLTQLRKDAGTGILLITHDIGLIAEYCSRILVMYCGRIVESCSYREFYQKPMHPYSAGLLASTPRITAPDALSGMAGNVTPPEKLGNGCYFAPRCERGNAQCREQTPLLQEENGRLIACHHPL